MRTTEGEECKGNISIGLGRDIVCGEEGRVTLKCNRENFSCNEQISLPLGENKAVYKELVFTNVEEWSMEDPKLYLIEAGLEIDGLYTYTWANGGAGKPFLITEIGNALAAK